MSAVLELATVILAPGPKGFFETSSFLLGVPLVILGAIGVLIALMPIDIRWPQRQPAGPAEPEEILPPPEGHPTAMTYIQVGAILAVVTAVEVAVYYVDVLEGALVAILLVLSAMKFALVALWFMHLRFDSPILSVLFTGGLVLVAALFAVVLASLGASLA
jgi:cytochrome c oxidase subunit 4